MISPDAPTLSETDRTDAIVELPVQASHRSCVQKVRGTGRLDLTILGPYAGRQ